jgi:hypothetical protein
MPPELRKREQQSVGAFFLMLGSGILLDHGSPILGGILLLIGLLLLAIAAVSQPQVEAAGNAQGGEARSLPRETKDR